MKLEDIRNFGGGGFRMRTQEILSEEIMHKRWVGLRHVGYHW